jgi:tRNA-Thr(GGU) m(6)t(6)A37 methyltransferase TsaA
MGRENDYSVKPIGTVRSPYASRGDAPKQGSESDSQSLIELKPEWSGALEGLGPGRDIWVLTFFHQADPPRTRIHPRGDPSRPLTGLFNTRAPSRPNPIGLSLVRLLAIDGHNLTVRGLEALDGTPVLDIKPYVPGIDQPRRDSSP